MLVWAAVHPYLNRWVELGLAPSRPRRTRQPFGWAAFT
jgi:hypothetical protein